jgi:sec-independent protein translocase protein TatA
MTLPGGAELFIILFIVLLFFGAKKLPGLAGSLGTSMREFRKATQAADEDDDAHGSTDDDDPSAPRES